MERFLTLLARAREEEEELTGLRLTDLTLEGGDLSSVGFRSVVFDHCRLLGCDGTRASFTDVTFQDCDLSNSQFPDGYWQRCRFTGCKALGAGLYGGLFQQVSFQGCQLGYANFDKSRLRHVTFTETDLKSGSLSNCTLKYTEFRDCALTQVSFVHTLLKGLDLTTCRIGGLTLSADHHELQGVVVDTFQAADLARRLGVVVKE